MQILVSMERALVARDAETNHPIAVATLPIGFVGTKAGIKGHLL